ncbi:MAG TPA: hypothetical protein VHT30_11675 [Acidimicrobiales bacterium]|nr:hypothetical protein [Acidimicrobiales bacterium]
MAAGLALGLIVGLGAGLDGGLAVTDGLACGLACGLIEEPGRDQLRASGPTDGYINSARIGLASGLAGGLVGGLVYGLTLGLAGGLFFGGIFGLGAPVFHWSWRWFWLRRRDWGPYRWPAFLAWCNDHLYLQSTGPAYQWLHLELRDHLADSFDQTAAPTPGP